MYPRAPFKYLALSISTPTFLTVCQHVSACKCVSMFVALLLRVNR